MSKNKTHLVLASCIFPFVLFWPPQSHIFLFKSLKPKAISSAEQFNNLLRHLEQIFAFTWYCFSFIYLLFFAAVNYQEYNSEMSQSKWVNKIAVFYTILFLSQPIKMTHTTGTLQFQNIAVFVHDYFSKYV